MNFTNSDLKMIRDALILITVVHSPIGRDTLGKLMNMKESEQESKDIFEKASAALEKIMELQVKESA